METNHKLFFVYGLCVMFYFTMTWFFVRRDNELLSRLIALLMTVMGLQCLKDLFFLSPENGLTDISWYIMSALDMIAVPLYTFILVELCRPSSLKIRSMIFHEMSFVVPIIIFIITRNCIFYYVTIVWTAIYGFSYAVWALFAIPKYHARLKQRFSYDENINLNWLRTILFSFFIILSLWVIDCMIFNIYLEYLYMIGSLIIWMSLCYFIYRHESVIDELAESVSSPDMCGISDSGKPDMSEMGRRVTDLFLNEKIYLNPNLKLSDIAKAIGTNRTYVSTFFNKEAGCTFYDYVNRLRIDYACNLLVNSKENLSQIAEKSGFNSSQSFIRVFSKIKDVSPTEYRKGVSD